MKTSLLVIIGLALASASCARGSADTGMQDEDAGRSGAGVAMEPVPAARFDAAYQAEHRGRTRVQVPEVYELVNIALALTPTVIATKGLAYERSDYYADVRGHFAPAADHRAVQMLDSALSRSPRMYFTLKMNAYAFEMDGDGRIVRSRVYDRTGFGSERTNTLLPYIEQLQSFADASGFREFYRRHQATYDAQIAFYSDTADVGGMQQWLNRSFPDRRPYDSYNIIFSPLVGHNQSVTWLTSNGFSELQPHVNFPYESEYRRGGLADVSEESRVLARGLILFTELNHGYINPEADRYAAEIRDAISRRDVWVDSTESPGYYAGNAVFTEYLNWALISLRYLDLAPARDHAALLADVERVMVRRGFPQFPAFNQHLIGLYRDRAPGVTVADLYPAVIQWFAQQNRSSSQPGSGEPQ